MTHAPCSYPCTALGSLLGRFRVSTPFSSLPPGPWLPVLWLLWGSLLTIKRPMIAPKIIMSWAACFSATFLFIESQGGVFLQGRGCTGQNNSYSAFGLFHGTPNSPVSILVCIRIPLSDPARSSSWLLTDHFSWQELTVQHLLRLPPSLTDMTVLRPGV